MPILGLDLGKNSVQAVELTKKGRDIVLLNLGTYEVPEDTDPNPDITKAPPHLDLKEFVYDSKFSTNKAIVSLPENQVFTTIVKVPEMNEKELEASLKIEAEQYIPDPIKDVNFSHQRMGPDPYDKGKMNVQLVAAKKSVVEDIVKTLKEADLVPKVVEPENFAICRALGDSEQKPLASIILNIGYSTTLIIICYKGFVRFTRTIPIGGDTITRALQQSLSLDYLQAEEYKKTYGLNKSQVDGKVYDIIKPIIDTITLEVKRSKIYFTSHNPDVNINRIVLAGGTAQMPDLLAYVANNIDVEVEIANPWKNIKFSPKLNSKADSILKNGPIYASAVGLALKGID